MREKEVRPVSGLAALLVLLAALAGSIYMFVQAVIALDRGTGTVPQLLLWIFSIALAFLLLLGLFTVAPNQGVVLQLFGRYVGTARVEGLRWTNPFYSKKKVSLRVRNFETQRLKVNDLMGNPIEIGAIVVWQVVDTAEAVFEVDDYQNYVHVQSESALRSLATQYPYDAHEDGVMSLRANIVEIAEHLKTEIQDRLAKAGVKVIEARISHLAYAAEIAAAMLQRQQASAIIAARQKIVDGAVGMVEMALARLDANNVVKLDDERKAAMVSNLLVVLCSERSTQPIVNAGSIYH
ncbi:MAG: SPFH domain-containing protein [Acidobacteria bacterium]|nr:SPFH domain-containing protein [Acidobacteriota bacterium]